MAHAAHGGAGVRVHLDHVSLERRAVLQKVTAQFTSERPVDARRVVVGRVGRAHESGEETPAAPRHGAR